MRHGRRGAGRRVNAPGDGRRCGCANGLAANVCSAPIRSSLQECHSLLACTRPRDTASLHMHIAHAGKCPAQLAMQVAGFGQSGSALNTTAVCAAEGRAARLFLVVDTNILLTHLAFLQRLRKAARGAPAPGARAGGGEPGADEPAAADVVVVVPWIVLYELDRIKSERPDSSKGALCIMPGLG